MPFSLLPGGADVVVVARKRQEALLAVPIAITAISGDTLAARGFHSIREAASLAPGLNINSDGINRAFIAIRGVGSTLVSTVQPGVGLLIDGIYQPNTAYLNNPLVDVDHIEILRGPQGTLYGKNTLGGAINVISRIPTNGLQAMASADVAGPDNAWTVAASLSGAIVPDKVQMRIGYAHRQQDGFLTRRGTQEPANALKTDSINTMLRLMPGDAGAGLTLKVYYDQVYGVSRPYARVDGPTDYARTVPINAENRTRYRYRGINGKLELPIDALATTATLIGAYDLRDGSTPDSDGDFGPANSIRSASRDLVRTSTAELRLDSRWTDKLSSLFGLFYSHEIARAFVMDNILPRNAVRTTDTRNRGDTYSAFGTLFWKPAPRWEITAGLRFDHEDRIAQGSVVTDIPGRSIGGPIADAQIRSDQVEPRLSITLRWNDRLMTYASVARGYRGGGFNGPTAPTRTYKGDSAWTYELGGKLATADGSVTLSSALFYNDYRDYIGLNSIAPAAGGGLVTVDLNTGEVESFGAELEATIRPTPRWTIRASALLMRARITDDSAYRTTTGRVLSSNRLTFQPDWTFDVQGDYVIPVGDEQLRLTAGVTGKGNRLAATLNQAVPTLLDAYCLTDVAVAFRKGPAELSVFVTNLFNERYFDSYIEKTTLQLAGLPPSDLGIIGDRRRVGLRFNFKF